MKKVWLGAIFVAALAAVTAWLSGVGRTPVQAAAAAAESGDAAYDYDARDVVVRQMGPDGSLQYEVVAKQVTQQPRNGQITASELTMHHDPAGTPPGGPRRWTLTADRADLPEDGRIVSLQGKVRAQGRLQKSPSQLTMVTEQLDYDLTTQDLSSDEAVDLTWAGTHAQGKGLRANIKSGEVTLESGVHATFSH